MQSSKERQKIADKIHQYRLNKQLKYNQFIKEKELQSISQIKEPIDQKQRILNVYLSHESKGKVEKL